MIQSVPCECGEILMHQGRCTGCKRVRPSALEAADRVDDLSDQLGDALVRLRTAIELEAREPTAAKES